MNLIILFSGQGLQSQRHIDEVLKVTSEHEQSLLKTVLPELFANDFDNAFDNETLFNNKVAQPFIYTLQYYRWQQLRKLIEKPIAFAGYSLGEINAFCYSSQLDFEAGLTLINHRAKFMEEEVSESSGLLAIQGLHNRELKNLLLETDTYLSIKINEDQFIIGGHTDNLSQADKLAQSLGARNTQLLKVSVPSHTKMMQKAAEKFREYTDSITLPAMQIPIISATDGIKYNNTNQGLHILSSQIDHSLDWYACMENIKEYQPSMIIEIGPGNALSKMINNLMPHLPCRSWDDFRNSDGLLEWILKNS
ncbi:malonate decarboxylase subunit epsilon [Psychrobacter sp. LV10R520-6]|uniref:malonate decarboxylase subunit epsilon n=1 Tax=Psychrobacter sp. LV10R520-6 TaxID=1415574 RepID=UPI0024C97B85|nr:malonate decarboxylase subunit epsilon [Psychrobacter sp. LV10R520-6]SNT70971.1 [acyl-carrier-protein] S-malonyltransferase [Psychrobacter sp. LV10R520-6]